jgi:hypothetical protein
VAGDAKGTVEVKTRPQPPEDTDDPGPGGSPWIKRFMAIGRDHKGQMLTAGTAVKGSAGFPAIERVSGTRRGHRGRSTWER